MKKEEEFSTLYYDIKQEVYNVFDMHIERLGLDTFDNGTVLMQTARDISKIMGTYHAATLPHDEMLYLNFIISTYYDDMCKHMNEMLIDELKKNKRI